MEDRNAFIRIETDNDLLPTNTTITTTDSDTYEVYQLEAWDEYERAYNAKLAEEEKMNSRIGWFISNKDNRLNPNIKDRKNMTIRNNLPKKIRKDVNISA